MTNAARNAQRSSPPRSSRTAIVLAVLAGLWTTQAAAQSVSDRIVGVYRLARFAGHGDEPTGRIAYDSAGRMWAMLLPPGRAPLTQSSSPEEYRATMRGVVAYYGTYTVDEDTGRVIHHVEAASNPAWVGDDFVRWYRFDGGNLLISLNPGFDNPLLWERLPDDPQNTRQDTRKETAAH
jgi:hypothetical protein